MRRGKGRRNKNRNRNTLSPIDTGDSKGAARQPDRQTAGSWDDKATRVLRKRSEDNNNETIYYNHSLPWRFGRFGSWSEKV